MKKKILYIYSLLCLTLAFTACESKEPELFDASANGAYFDYKNAAEYEQTLNFADHMVGYPDSVTVELKVKLLGYLMDEARTLAVKTKEVEGYEPAGVKIKDVIFANKEYEKNIEVKVKRPDVEDQTYAICIYLDGSGDIGTGVVGKNEINLYVTDTYEALPYWSEFTTYLGGWSKEKQIFLANHKKSNTFYANLYKDEMAVYDSLVALNTSAVNALLAVEPAEPETFSLPILNASYYPEYTEPYFWKDYKEYIGPFRSSKLCKISILLGNANTSNFATLMASEDGLQIMKDEANNFNKEDVLYMLEEYYNYALEGYPLSEYKDRCWAQIKNSLTYDVRIPFWWEDPLSLGTAEIVKKYFGEYSDKKYQFILKEIMKKDGAEDFVPASIFPFVYNKDNNTYTWDNTPFGEKQLSGEERLKECYRIVKKANDPLPSIMKHDIPEGALD